MTDFAGLEIQHVMNFAGAVWYAAKALVPWVAGTWVLYWLATLPWRRKERARLLLEILQMGIRAGKPAEIVIREACATRDPALPVRMQLIAAHLSDGLSFAEALRKTAGFLPPDVEAGLQWGARHGRWEEAIALSRDGLTARPNASQGAMLAVGTMLLWPSSTAVLFLFLSRIVFPRMAALGSEFEVDAPPITYWVFQYGWMLALLVLAVKLALYALAFGRTGGPWIDRILPMARIANWMPWRRQRIQRRFAQLLALGLDLGLPESEAVLSAGAGTGNAVWQSRSARVAETLRDGWRMDAAIAQMDSSPEFHWRLSMAVQRGRRATESMRGWVEDLESRAERNELMAAQSFLTFAVLSNALLVGLTAVGLISMLVSILEVSDSW